MTALEILKAGRALIAERKNWTQKRTARNSVGLPTVPASPDACSWCSIGALVKTGTNDSIDAAPRAFTHLEAAMNYNMAGRVSVASFNDSHTHEEVLAAWDRAIQNATESEANS